MNTWMRMHGRDGTLRHVHRLQAESEDMLGTVAARCKQVGQD